MYPDFQHNNSIRVTVLKPGINFAHIIGSHKKLISMKRTLLLLTLFIGGASLSSFAQDANEDSTGTPGDHFSLEGALDLFKQAQSPEEFEKLLNTESNHVNNLDLNGDGDIDYIKVINKKDGDAQVLVLQVPVNENENQDIAVIEIEKNGAESASIQIIGDEDIFGEEVVVEPKGEDEKTPGGPYWSHLDEQPAGVIVNVWLWPSVRFMYAPGYRLWVSPWRWHAYPAWWRPWRPVRWSVFHPYCVRYRPYYAYAPAVRLTYAHRVYSPIRTTSVVVRNRHAVAVNHYRVNRKTTTVVGPRGNRYQRTTTTVRGRNGHVVGRKTSVRRRRG